MKKEILILKNYSNSKALTKTELRFVEIETKRGVNKNTAIKEILMQRDLKHE